MNIPFIRFTAVSWDSSSGWKSDPNAFIFSLTNKYIYPVKVKIHPIEHHEAIFCDSEYGPTFGRDIRISNNANTTMYSYYNLGLTYRPPQCERGTNEAQTLLAESYNFHLDEIEVYQKELKFSLFSRMYNLLLTRKKCL